MSTVSGGSLATGMVYAANDYKWPTSPQMREVALPRARELLTGTNLQRSFIRKILTSPGSLFRSRARDISGLMQKLWGITADLHEVGDHPRWLINATCYETGHNWRFENRRMGDYMFGHAQNPGIPLADAMAASAGLPAGIGPLVLDTQKWSWVRFKEGSTTETEPVTPAFNQVHLWDGGLYDNLGVEALFKTGGGFRDDVDFLIVSDAGARPDLLAYRWGTQPLMRIVSIATDQVRSLRARAVVGHLIREGAKAGRYLQIDNTCADILRDAGLEAEIPEACKDSLPEEEVRLAAEMSTHIRKLSPAEMERLFRQGFEVADFTLYAWAPDEFPLKGYGSEHGG